MGPWLRRRDAGSLTNFLNGKRGIEGRRLKRKFIPGDSINPQKDRKG
jgi:hypothetical protein